MIAIRTNRPEYRNDIAEEIRLFLGIVEVALLPEDGEADLVFDLRLEKDGTAYTLTANAGGILDATAFTIQGSDPLLTKKHEKRQMKLAAYRLLQRLYPEVSTPWGSLTGIRPTKLYRELTREGGRAAAERTFRDTFDVSEQKTWLAATICRVQEPVIASAGPMDLDVYIGIPFCRTRCLYCSFASEVLGKGALLDEYFAALLDDIRRGGQLAKDGGYRIRALYVGGGTPTVLSAEQLKRLLEAAGSAYGTFIECTVEAGRPDTIDREKLCALREMGVGRISINPQTMNDVTLQRIGRAHTVQETVDAFRLAREIGFASINMDLIAGLPGERPADMDDTLGRVAALAPENLTVHALAIKRSSRLKAQLDAYPLPSPEETDRMIAAGLAAAGEMGMVPYYMYRQKYMNGNLENVGYCLPDKVCAYNIDMMEETVSILSHGAGSMTKRVFGCENRIERLPSPKDVPTYLGKLDEMEARRRSLFLD